MTLEAVYRADDTCAAENRHEVGHVRCKLAALSHVCETVCMLVCCKHHGALLMAAALLVGLLYGFTFIFSILSEMNKIAPKIIHPLSHALVHTRRQPGRQAVTLVQKQGISPENHLYSCAAIHAN